MSPNKPQQTKASEQTKVAARPQQTKPAASSKQPSTVKVASKRVSIKTDYEGNQVKVSKMTEFPTDAESFEDLLFLCEGKLKTERGEHPGVIDAAIQGINMYRRRKVTAEIQSIIGGREKAVENIAAGLEGLLGKKQAREVAESTVDSVWTDEMAERINELEITPLTEEEQEDEV